MNNPKFIDEETIPLVHQDEDYDDYNTPNTSRILETFTEPTIDLTIKTKSKAR